MQQTSVGSQEIIEICEKYLRKYYDVTSVEDKRRYFNILYALISQKVTKSSISNYRDFYNWCTHDDVTNKILNDVNMEVLQDKSKTYTIINCINTLENQLNELKKLVKKECV